MWQQTSIALQPKSRGFHLISQEIIAQLPELTAFTVGLAHIFMQHTSASLCINENADPDVRHDMEAHFNHSVPQNQPYYRHILEGADDMPAHIKSSTLGNSITIPIRNGAFALGIWQGIYLGEHRDHGGSRRLIITLHGE